MLETCRACKQDFLTEADPYVVRPTPQGYMLYCSCMIVGHGQVSGLDKLHDRIAALEQLAEMVIDPRSLEIEDGIGRAAYLWSIQERARELMEVKDG